MAAYPKAWEVYLALTRLLEIQGHALPFAVAFCGRDFDGRSAVYTVRASLAAKEALSKILTQLLQKPFPLEAAHWTLTAHEAALIVRPYAHKRRGTTRGTLAGPAASTAPRGRKLARIRPKASHR